MDFLTQERQRGRITFQVADVKRPLLAVSTLTRAGNGATFGTNGGNIVNRRTGTSMSFVKRDGIYILELMVAPRRWGRGLLVTEGTRVLPGRGRRPAGTHKSTFGLGCAPKPPPLPARRSIFVLSL